MTSEDWRDPLVGGGGSGGSRCPEAERLAEYVDDVLGVSERADLEAHLAGCQACRAVVTEAATFVRGQGARGRLVPFRPRRWATAAAAAAAAAVVVVALRVEPTWIAGWFASRSDRPELQELVAAVANEPRRPAEGRLTGGFKYAPPPSPTRGAGDRESSPDVRIAAAKIEKLAREHDSPENQAALGVAFLALGDPAKAVAALEIAVSRDPSVANFQTDLAAAYLARGRREGRADDYPRALTAAEKAIRLDPNVIEAYFDRALALDALRQTTEAPKAWEDYIRRDPSSPWRDEAEARRGVDIPIKN